jgi:hypothetical protein
MLEGASGIRVWRKLMAEMSWMAAYVRDLTRPATRSKFERR